MDGRRTLSVPPVATTVRRTPAPSLIAQRPQDATVLYAEASHPPPASFGCAYRFQLRLQPRKGFELRKDVTHQQYQYAFNSV